MVNYIFDKLIKANLSSFAYFIINSFSIIIRVNDDIEKELRLESRRYLR